jgi:GNAT superfamily N-acetyltransferase
MRFSDVEAVAGLVSEFAQYMRELGDTTEPRLTAEALTRDGFGPRPAFDGLVAETDGVVTGFLLYHDGYDTDEATRLVFIVDLFVRRDVRKLGTGAALVREVARLAKDRGAAQLVWTVDKRNTEAVAFYERQGARTVDWLHLMYLEL